MQPAFAASPLACATAFFALWRTSPKEQRPLVQQLTANYLQRTPAFRAVFEQASYEYQHLHQKGLTYNSNYASIIAHDELSLIYALHQNDRRAWALAVTTLWRMGDTTTWKALLPLIQQIVKTEPAYQAILDSMLFKNEPTLATSTIPYTVGRQ